MSLDDDLLDAIAAAPEDPAPRLIYADHRLSRLPHDPHAELIVIEERLEAMGARHDRRWRDYFAREAVALYPRDQELVDTLVERFELPKYALDWHRGFVDGIYLGESDTELLRARVHLPVFRVVRLLAFANDRVERPLLERLAPTVRRVEYRITAEQRAALGHIDELLVEVDTAECATLFDHLKKVELVASDDDEAVRDALAFLPSLDELVVQLATDLGPRTLEALAPYRERVRFVVEPAPRIERSIASLACGRAYLALGRAREAAHAFDDAFCFSRGELAEAEELYADAARRAGITRRLTDPDPERDPGYWQVPALLRWGQLDRVLHAAPNHAGAWTIRGLSLREGGDLDGAAAAFGAALDGEPHAAELGRAYAFMTEDLPAARAVMERLATEANAVGAHATVLLAVLRVLDHEKLEVALAPLVGLASPEARLALGLADRHRRVVDGRALLEALARPPKNVDPFSSHAPWLVALVAAIVTNGDYEAIRQALQRESERLFLVDSYLLVDALVALARKEHAYLVALKLVAPEVDRLRGA